MPQKKLAVVTDVGTFTRQTARTYTHIVVVKDDRREVLEAQRVAHIAGYRKESAQNRKVVAQGYDPTNHSEWSRAWTAEKIASGELLQWASEADAKADALEASGPITTDRETPWGVLSWCGRLDLARKEYASRSASYYRHVRIYDVITGQQVRW